MPIEPENLEEPMMVMKNVGLGGVSMLDTVKPVYGEDVELSRNFSKNFYFWIFHIFPQIQSMNPVFWSNPI